ncbi:hypothetical protein PG988_003256 [Apiospora saccharicola]
MYKPADSRASEANKNKPMSNDLKIAMGLLESLHPGFKLRNWQAIADENRNSLATVKQRLPKTIAKYKEVCKDGINVANSTSAPATVTAPVVPPSFVPAPSATAAASVTTVTAAAAPVVPAPIVPAPVAPVNAHARPNLRAAPSLSKRAVPHGEEHEEDDHDDDMAPPRAPTGSRRVTRSATQASRDAGNGVDPFPRRPRPAKRRKYVFPTCPPPRIALRLTDHARLWKKKSDKEKYEAGLLEFGGHWGQPVPRDRTYQEWFFPGDSWDKEGDDQAAPTPADPAPAAPAAPTASVTGPARRSIRSTAKDTPTQA